MGSFDDAHIDGYLTDQDSVNRENKDGAPRDKKKYPGKRVGGGRDSWHSSKTILSLEDLGT